MKFRNKLILVGITNIFIISIFSIIYLFLTSKNEKDFKEIKEVELKKFKLVSEMKFMDSELTGLIIKYILNDTPSILVEYNTKAESLDKILSEHKKSSTEMEKENFTQIDKANTELIQLEDQIIKLVKQKKISEAETILLSKNYTLQKKILAEGILNLFTLQEKNMDTKILEFESRTSFYTKFFLLIGILFFCITFSFVIWQNYSFSNPLEKLKKSMKEILNGKLNSKIDYSNPDEFLELSNLFNSLTENLKLNLNLIKNIEYKIDSSSKSLSNDSIKFNEIAAIYSSSTEEISVSLDEISKSSKSFQNSLSLTKEATETIQENINKMVNSNQEIYSHIITLKDRSSNSEKKLNNALKDLNSTVSIISEIKNSIKQITEFTKIISDISDQTNLLSLNASIEASRAGEQGKGFAVVASEITKLAESSKKSVFNVREASKNILHIIDIGYKQIHSISIIFNEVEKNFTQVNRDVELIFSHINQELEATKIVHQEINSLQSSSETLQISMSEQQTSIEMIASSMHSFAQTAYTFATYSDKFRDLSIDFQSNSTELKRSLADYSL
jgi:methyl-accepting chemotaxis protein